MRTQVEENVARLADADNAKLVRDELAKATTPTRVAAVLSRVEGMLAVERAAMVDQQPADPPELTAAEPAQAEDEPVESAPTDDAPEMPAEALDATGDSMDAEIMASLVDRIADAPNAQALAAIVPDIKAAQLPPAEEQRVRDAYAARSRALKGGA